MESLREYVRKEIQENVIPNLEKFIEIENVSSAYDPEWATNGLQEQAVQFCYDWAMKQGVKGLNLVFHKEEGRTPLLYGTVEGSNEEESKRNIFMYGHIDKQPPLTENWSEGLHPYKPVIRDGKLYGRGSSDDGYAFFISLLMVKAYQHFKMDHPRFVLFFETDEESGSKDLIYYVEKFKDVIRTPNVIVCLDSGALGYDTFYATTTLRGMTAINMKVSVLKEGVHSGDASGVTPSCFRIARDLLSRIEDPKNGQVVNDFQVNIPSDKYEQIEKVIKEIGTSKQECFPFLEGVKTVEEDAFRNYVNRIWKAQLTVVGVSGLPDCSKAGNVCHPFVEFRLSLRLPPTMDSGEALKKLTTLLTTDVPYGAKVEISGGINGNGWNCNPYNDAFKTKLTEICNKEFNKDPIFYGEGGSIPFVGAFQKMFPDSLFMVTGVLGPNTNAHGPDEFLPIEYLKQVSVVMTELLKEKF